MTMEDGTVMEGGEHAAEEGGHGGHGEVLTSDTDLLLRADERALTLVPDSRLTVVEGSEHPLPWFVPERFAREIVSFVAG